MVLEPSRTNSSLALDLSKGVNKNVLILILYSLKIVDRGISMRKVDSVYFHIKHNSWLENEWFRSFIEDNTTFTAVYICKIIYRKSWVIEGNIVLYLEAASLFSGRNTPKKNLSLDAK